MNVIARLVEKAMFAPIWQLAAMSGVGLFSAPYEDVKLKAK